MNDVVPAVLRLRLVHHAEDAAIAAEALAIVFDRVAFVARQRERVIGFRALDQ